MQLPYENNNLVLQGEVVDSEHRNLSGYIMDELGGALADGGFEVADHRNLEIVYKELNFQMSGDVSDETAVSIGKFLAAEYAISGQLIKAGGRYRYRVSVINVETAVLESSVRLDVRDSRAMTGLVADLRSAKVSSPAAYSSPPGTPGAFLDRGILFAVRGDFALAIEDFTEAIRLDGTRAAAYMFRGRAFDASVSYVLEIAEDFSGFNSIYGDSKTITEEQKAGYNKAIADYSQAISLDPNLAGAYKVRGVAYINIGDYDRAIADCNQAIRLDPNNAAAYINRGIVYHKKATMTVP
jgi:tetratricopeptide (TPR) repeat protein